MRRVLVLSFLFAATVLRAEQPGPIIVAGSARFTVIAPTCIRLEFAPDGRFVDAPSMFAVGRDAAFRDFKLDRTTNGVTIDTGIIRLRYQPDGKPFNAGNLQAQIARGKEWVPWHAGLINHVNLGGTIRTLDRVKGPVDLGEGLLSPDGWYLLDDSHTHLLVDNWAMERPQNGNTDWYLFGYGTDYKAALKALTLIGGPVPMPRKYVLGSWYSRYWPYSSSDFRQIVQQYKDHDFPLDVMVMDMDWHRDGWTGWSWNRKLLPDAEDLLRWFHQQGLRVTLNVHPSEGVCPHEDMYDAFMHAMGQDPASQETLPYDAGDRNYLDTLFQYTHAPLEREGVDFWWLDWQQERFTRSLPHLTNLAWLNQYYYQWTGRNGLRGQSFSRWAGWGDHRHPIHFSGDADTGWKMLAFEVPFTSTAGNVGCFFWSHDIGGHTGGRNEESYIRWAQFGALSAALRPHSTRKPDMDRRPWTYSRQAEDSMRISFHLRSELFPYIYSSVWESCAGSIPLTRPMYIEYPDRDEAYQNPQQYLFGDNLLVAPITTPGESQDKVAQQTVWFPPGEWYDWFSGKRFAGEHAESVSADINRFPLYAKGGVPIPLQPYSPRMTSAPLTNLVIRCYPGPDGSKTSTTLYEDDGVTTGYLKGESSRTLLTYGRSGNTVTVTVSASQGGYPGQIEDRFYTLELPETDKPRALTINGKPAQASYDETSRTLHVGTDLQSVRKPVVFSVTYP